MNKMLKIRKALSLSQTEMAARLGITQPCISRYEKGKTKIDARTALALDALEATIAQRDAA